MVEGMELFTAFDAASWTGGELIGEASCAVYSAAVDSRKCRAGSLFFALRGERADGHDFLDQAFAGGACGAVVSEEWWSRLSAPNRDLSDGKCFYLVVADPLKALQLIASEYLKRIKGPVRIGITGSNGKTTTKELIAGVLSEKYSVVKTDGNYNSEIGLALTVFNIKENHDYAVIEMGINRVGEMDVLSEILCPDIVVITNIGTAHIGIFKNMETIAYEKRQAASCFTGKELLFIAEDEPFKDFLVEDLNGKAVSFGENTLKADYSDFSCRNIGLHGWEIKVEKYQVRFPLVGSHNLKNALCAYSVGLSQGLSHEQIGIGLEKSVALFGRSQIIEGPVTIIHDSYNSNADSLQQSILFADELVWTGPKRYVVADMK
jgi:UDP-N-acetylmuramoyl-tripeptide--D-alanyl-D-alanine ligase